MIMMIMTSTFCLSGSPVNVWTLQWHAVQMTWPMSLPLIVWQSRKMHNAYSSVFSTLGGQSIVVGLVLAPQFVHGKSRGCVSALSRRWGKK